MKDLGRRIQADVLVGDNPGWAPLAVGKFTNQHVVGANLAKGQVVKIHFIDLGMLCSFDLNRVADVEAHAQLFLGKNSQYGSISDLGLRILFGYLCLKTPLVERKIIQTSDGSKSIYLPQLDETYHSRHGAIQEAYHVFIRSGLDLFEEGRVVRLLEMGFGTGLNCFITWLEAKRRKLNIRYCGLEAYPVSLEVALSLIHI